jgi:hypothetical protein
LQDNINDIFQGDDMSKHPGQYIQQQIPGYISDMFRAMKWASIQGNIFLIHP